ncbi:uncharacterized protein B0P05DRAFT_270026 [Gilbertella persicaria]|uniref:uncharacterized protein n=1 Tax=Gilbertella persicaria TaxID=101096 RepID=UPI00221EA6EC|nr:uncharacterized protein B0P05DRAFT_270026 [Gilbertella persicaria]KAI8059990.1 hypothetical protein B0P05DRAFT_270026 [Gilbertella persicaria]
MKKSKSTHNDKLPNITDDVEKAIEQSPLSSPTSTSSKEFVELISNNATTQAILNLKNNPFFHDKRKWEDSFSVAEIKELAGNIVKAAKDNDGETYVTLQEEEYTVPASTHEDESSQESDNIDSTNKKPGRKPMPDEESFSDLDQDPKVKRKAQNRAAQRAFRERKERYVKELEIKIKQIQDAHLVTTTQLVRENQQLRSVIYRLESENYALKGIPYQPPPPLQTPPPPPQSGPCGHYPNIAPLLPQEPLALSSYSTTPSTPSILHSISPSLGSISPSKPISKKVSVKQKSPTPTPPPQPLEYTFSITTPASLKLHTAITTSPKPNRSEPIEPVQLYHPSTRPSKRQSTPTSPLASTKPDSLSLNKNDSVTVVSSASAKKSGSVCTPIHSPIAQQQDDTNSVFSDNTTSTTCTQQQKGMQQLSLHLFDCHIDPEGKHFCETLHEQVCNDAFFRLLSEPLFDQMGKLNLSLIGSPVPIVTGSMKSLEDKDTTQDNTIIEKSKDKEDTPYRKHLLTCPEIWFALTQHSKFSNYTTNQLCQAVKDAAKCSDTGPVLEETDLQKIMIKMDQDCL